MLADTASNMAGGALSGMLVKPVVSRLNSIASHADDVTKAMTSRISQIADDLSSMGNDSFLKPLIQADKASLLKATAQNSSAEMTSKVSSRTSTVLGSGSESFGGKALEIIVDQERNK